MAEMRPFGDDPPYYLDGMGDDNIFCEAGRLIKGQTCPCDKNASRWRWMALKGVAQTPEIFVTYLAAMCSGSLRH